MTPASDLKMYVDPVIAWTEQDKAEVIERFLEAVRLSERECECDLKTKLVGDGCDVCNPELAQECGGAQ